MPRYAFTNKAYCKAEIMIRRVAKLAVSTRSDSPAPIEARTVAAGNRLRNARLLCR